ncbi:MAG: PD-(D/E)XK nuclease family protein, partial [Chloroflexota bacterium]
LHERSGHYNFMRDYGTTPQAISPLLTRSGARFEKTIEREVQARFPTLMLGTKAGGGGRRDNDNARVVDRARGLAAGDVLLIFQPRLEVAVAGWQLRGDLDILRLERDAKGALHILIADMKSSSSAKVEHRLQVAFYHEMVAALFDGHVVPYSTITLGILYRGPADSERPLTAEDAAIRESQLAAAEATFGTRAGLLELVSEADDYIAAVSDLVTGPASTATRVGRAEFDALPYHLTAKCDGCLYNEFCMKWSAERDDLSLLPHISAQDKGALRRAGVMTARQTAALKVLQPADQNDGQGPTLTLVPETADLVRRLSATWPVGPRLDELIHRAQRYRKWKGDPIEALSYIPGKGYGSLPFSAPTHNPNLVRVYIDAQQDYLGDRLYMLGALVVGCENGEPAPERRRGMVHLAGGPPDSRR